MRLRWKVLIVFALAAVAAVWAEFVRDIRTPRASLVEIHAIGTSVSIQMDDIHRVGETMKKKYGPDAETVLVTKPPRMITRVDNKVVAEAKAPGQFLDAIGFFVVGPRGHRGSTFPFQIDPRKAPQPGRKGEPSVRSLKSRFGKEVPDRYFDFDDRDAVTDRCIGLAPADLVGIGKLLQIQSGTSCVIFWRGQPSGSMLISVVLADGDPWMRPFSRRICRWLMSTALTRVAATDREPPPDYAACLLVDRPDRSGAAETLETYVFEVRRDSSLAYVN
jgi:hypothetical protein